MRYPKDLIYPNPSSTKIQTQVVDFTMAGAMNIVNVNYTGRSLSHKIWEPSSETTKKVFRSTTTIPFKTGFNLQRVIFDSMVLKLDIATPLQIGDPLSEIRTIYPWKNQANHQVTFTDVVFMENRKMTIYGYGQFRQSRAVND